MTHRACALRPQDLAPDGPTATETWLGGPALSYPNRPRSVAEVLHRAVAAWPDAEAVRDRDGSVRYAELADRVAGCVTALRSAGLRAGDGLTVAAANSVDFLVVVLACARSGIVLSGVNLKLATPRWSDLMRSTGARLALADPARLDAQCEAAAAVQTPSCRWPS